MFRSKPLRVHTEIHVYIHVSNPESEFGRTLTLTEANRSGVTKVTEGESVQSQVRTEVGLRGAHR